MCQRTVFYKDVCLGNEHIPGGRLLPAKTYAFTVVSAFIFSRTSSPISWDTVYGRMLLL
jgi:hypothetical protein